MSSIADRYRRRADAVERAIAAVGPDQWAAPTPCEEWTVLDLVDHMVSMHGVVLLPTGRSLPKNPTIADDPLGAFRDARAEVEQVLADPALAAVQGRTPEGPMRVDHQIDQVLSDDLPQHLWDLTRATGQDDTIDPDDVERLWAVTTAIPSDLMEKYRTPGAFGPGIVVFGAEVPVSVDAPLQDRLLGLLGRDPAWTPPPR